MSQDLSTTSYALLGLLVFDGPSSPGLTGYELKQRADRTLRFYWVSPAMSQVYTEVNRLTTTGMIEACSEEGGGRTTRRYRITTQGLDALRRWLLTSSVEFPILKHPVALKLLMGRFLGEREVRTLLNGYLDQLAVQRADLQGVRDYLGDVEDYRYPAMVADWGLDYYASEADIVRRLLTRLGDDDQNQEPDSGSVPT